MGQRSIRHSQGGNAVCSYCLVYPSIYLLCFIMQGHVPLTPEVIQHQASGVKSWLLDKDTQPLAPGKWYLIIPVTSSPLGSGGNIFNFTICCNHHVTVRSRHVTSEKGKYAKNVLQILTNTLKNDFKWEKELYVFHWKTIKIMTNDNVMCSPYVCRIRLVSISSCTIMNNGPLWHFTLKIVAPWFADCH